MLWAHAKVQINTLPVSDLLLIEPFAGRKVQVKSTVRGYLTVPEFFSQDLFVQRVMQQVRTVQQATQEEKNDSPLSLHVRVNLPREHHKDGNEYCCCAQSGRWAE